MINIAKVYEDKDNLLKRIRTLITYRGFDGGSGKFFDCYEVGCPVIFDDGMARQWLELNYLFSTGFRPNGRAGIGEIGADIRTAKEIDGQKYLTVPVDLLFLAMKALNDFRPIEEVCAEWMEKEDRYLNEVSELSKTVKSLSKRHPALKMSEEVFKNIQGYIGNQYVGMPSELFVSELEKLSGSLKGLPDGGPEANKAGDEAARLSKELARYSSAIPQMSKIRKYHKRFPYISENGMIRISAPAFSGGLSVHTHPGYDDPYDALPSKDDMLLIAAESGALPNVVRLGGGETPGEHYVMHIPRKFFFDEVKELVDRSGASDEQEIMRIKDEVLGKRLLDIMEDEILGFKVDGKNGKRTAVFSPIVTSGEYEKHQEYLESSGMEGRAFGAKDIIFDIGNGYVLYAPELKGFLMENIKKLMGHYGER